MLGGFLLSSIFIGPVPLVDNTRNNSSLALETFGVSHIRYRPQVTGDHFRTLKYACRFCESDEEMYERDAMGLGEDEEKNWSEPIESP